MKLDKNTYGTVVLVYLFSLAAIALAWLLIDEPFAYWAITLVFVWFMFWQTMFHLVPKRKRNGDASRVTAVADGKIVILEKVFESEFLKRECMMLSIYMDFWDVHANFWPVDGEVVESHHYDGHHHYAFKPKASSENEHSCVLVRTAQGKELMFKQIAGTFARRIVCYARKGLKTVSGEQCGIIKFGSRIDMFLPLDADIKVGIGERVRACETVLAEI